MTVAKILEILEEQETLVEALWAAADWCYTQKKDLEQTMAFMDEFKNNNIRGIMRYDSMVS